MDNGPATRKLEPGTPPDHSSAGARLQTVQARLAQAAAEAGRSAAEIGLLAVSKTFGAAAVRDLAACGQREFGE
ncbi:MAG: YggS family pyridoxal phosphate enzyme, partial [Proteobacteria bacterium]|nr:YggS family pyridoxal phosphate enzyme [Pseudomonadota bacterium]